MSIRIIVFSFLLAACEQPMITSDFNLEDYSQEERDSLSELYKELSFSFVQVSNVHRLAKDTAILFKPNDVGNIQVLSYSYKKAGEHIKAMEILNKAVELDVAQGSVDALQYRAWSLLYFYRDYKGTIKDVDLIYTMEGSDYPICWSEPCGLLKGQALYKLGRYEEAIKEFQYVLEVEKARGYAEIDNFLVNFYLGRCFHDLKEFDKAISRYQLVLALDDDYTEALYQLGVLFLELNDRDSARLYLENALQAFKRGYRMNEPYFERFDEVFLYQIEEGLSKI